MPDLLVLLVAEPTLTIAYVIFGLVGFGTTLVSAPVLAHVLPLTTVVPALALTDLLAAWTNGSRLGQHMVRREILRLVPAMFVGSALGAWILFAVPVMTLMLMLGVFIVLYALNGLRPQQPRPPIGAGWAWWFGGAGGVLSALFGAGGWVYSMYLVRRLDDPQQIRATQTALLMMSSLIRAGMFAAAGRYFDMQLLLLVLALLPAVGLGLYIGHRINLKMDRRRFMQVLYGVLMLTGTSLIVHALARL
ncbi:MAG: putative permease [Polaromonas sp.]|nr:putative permease [Polaromonas sp.]